MLRKMLGDSLNVKYQAQIPWEIQTQCSFCRLRFSSPNSRSFSPISSFSSLSPLISLLWCLSRSFRKRISNSFSSLTLASQSASLSSANSNCFSSWSFLRSAEMSLSFMREMCSSRLPKLSVSMPIFSWSERSLASELRSWTSRELMLRDFSASMSSSTWISDSISHFCRSSSSVSISSLFFSYSSWARRSVSKRLFSLNLRSSPSRVSTPFLSSLALSSRQAFFSLNSLVWQSLLLISLCTSSVLRSNSLRNLLTSSSLRILMSSIWQFFSFWNWERVSPSKLTFCMYLFSWMFFQQRSFSAQVDNCLFCPSSCFTCNFRVSYSFSRARSLPGRCVQSPILPGGCEEAAFDRILDVLVGVQSLSCISNVYNRSPISHYLHQSENIAQLFEDC